MFALLIVVTSEKCSSAQVSRSSRTNGLLIPNIGMSSLWRLHEKVSSPPCFFILSQKQIFVFPYLSDQVFFDPGDFKRLIESVNIDYLQAALIVVLGYDHSFNQETFNESYFAS